MEDQSKINIGKKLRMFDVGEEEDSKEIKCPKCGSQLFWKGGKREIHPKGSNVVQFIQTYKCLQCKHHFSIRPYKGSQYSEILVKLALRLQQEMNNGKVAEVIKDVYGVSVTRITIGYWRMKFGNIYAWHKWKKLDKTNRECIYCELRATIKEIHDGKLKPCIAKLNLRRQKNPHERIAKRSDLNGEETVDNQR